YLDNLFNYANAPIIVWDIHGRITRFNRAFEHMTGLFADKVIGQELSILFPESSRDESLGKIQRTLSGEYWKSVEIPILRKDGDVRTALWNSANVFDKDGITVIATIAQGQDITERKQAEEALRKSEKKYRHLFENAPSGIYEIDYEQFRFVNVNEFICKSTGYSEKELLSMNPMDLLTEDSKTLYIERLEKLSTEEKPDRNVEYDIITKNGHKLNVILNIDFISKNGKLTGARIVTHDITELKKLEEELRQARKMESIGTLTGGIAHDFNNILGIIVGNTELALEDVPKWNPAYSSLEEIKTASLRAANIVRQLLSFSRKTDQKLQPMEIAAVIKEALKFLRSTIPKTIDIEQDISVTNETILADPTQINQIIMNLCINASHAMEQTGGNLTIIVENVLLDDHSAKDYPDLKSGKYVKVMVSDTGSGIDPKIIDRIFDPYFTTKGIGKGSGMGLSVVHGIVKNHGGAITVDSSPGKGTKFSMFFPLATEKPMVETQTTQEIPRGSETILFVDDEISIVNMVQRMLERLGYKVETATTPQDALERFALNPDNFDLVITDMTMPRMTGVKLSEKLMAIRPDIPIIICTGYSALVDEEKAKELGLAAYVMKPINLLETAKTIRKVLDKK
ncbi:MAG: PAS domain S-box protein, partial [Proteobacteria bacterium]|nr:PAS domain S-box protein [Pseudomonadota bacterium]